MLENSILREFVLKLRVVGIALYLMKSGLTLAPPDTPIISPAG